MQIAQYVSLEEYQCPHCGELPPTFNGELLLVYSQLFDDFSVIRGQWGKAIPISSGYRCPKHNASIGGALLSAHIFGLALDLDVNPDEVDDLNSLIEEVASHLRRGKYTEAGSFIHIDNAYEIFPRPKKSFIQGYRWFG